MADDLRDLSLLTDLYELTMAQSYVQQGMFAPATFSLFIRRYPPNRGYFVSAGLEEVLRYLEEFHFTPEALDYLRSTDIFSREFLDYLRGMRFTGDVWAIPEGRLFFCDEPVLEVTAPMPEAQLVEPFVINQINLQSLIATKATRCVWAAQGRELMDFSLRRAQGTDAGMKAARASYIVGFQSTSNVLAGKAYGIPIAGTMAHSFISSFDHEIDSFRAFVESFPDRSVLLVDTYDTLAGVQKAVQIAKELEEREHYLLGVRLDSGDLFSLSRQVRYLLDQAGLEYVHIFASGGLDEYAVEELVSLGAPIDGFGVGTLMGVSADAPYFDMAYKLVRYDHHPVLKLSTDKVSLPDEKQVFRRYSRRGQLLRDVIALRDEPLEQGEPLLVKVMEQGRRVEPPPPLEEIRERFQDEFDRLDEHTKALRNPLAYEVTLSPRLRQLLAEMQRDVVEAEVSPPSRPRELGES